MSDGKQQNIEDHLPAYLDGQLNGQEKATFERLIESNEAARSRIELQKRIDASLKERFDVTVPETVDVEQLLNCDEYNLPFDEAASQISWVRVALVAACLFVALISWLVLRPAQREIAFQPESLVSIYKKTVERGFEPYYECEDHERFSSTFQRRQGSALYLLDMPDDRRMTGLSYSGGLSRESTSVLCFVEDQPVMVFVARAENDEAGVAAPTDEINVFRSQRDGLVFYEVSPLDGPKVSKFLSVTKAGALDF